MKKLKTLILAALTAVGACAAFGNNNSYIKYGSMVWFDTASVPDYRDYNSVYVMYRDSYDAWFEDGSSLLALADASVCSSNFADGSHSFYADGMLCFTNDFKIGDSVARGETASDFAILFSDDLSGYFLVDSEFVDYRRPSADDNFTITMQKANAFTSADLKPFNQPKPISAVSAEGFLDLTVGDRVAKVPEETLVVDPAWGEAATATVAIEGESGPRTYMCASNDTWQTAPLTPGRYAMALTAGATNETAAFWKTGDDWVVHDLPPSSGEGVFFESGKTHLILGTTTFTGEAPLEVEDGAKFEYGAGAGFKGGKLEAPRRYRKETVEGDLYRIVEAIKGCADNPWEVGNGVEAYTNGTKLVIVGAGTIMDLSEIPADVKRGIAAITVVDATVKDAAAGVFYGFDKVTVTLQENWQGELPDEKSTWHGATNVKLTRVPTAVRNVKPQQRYPWNGLVDVDFDLTGEGAVKVTLSVTTNGVTAVEIPTVTGETTFDLGKGKELKDLRLVWDAKADFGDAELHQKIKVKLSVEKTEAE